MTKTELSKVISGAIAQIMEHCDTVQIFATRVDPDTDITSTFILGKGNALARIKQAEDWVVAMDDTESADDPEEDAD